MFKFLYRSASDIRAAGFDTVGNPPNLSSNSKGDRSANLTGKMANTLSAAAIATDEKPFISLKALPELSINQAGSGSHQPPEIATVKATGENENSGHVELMKDELEVAASAKAAQVFDSATVIAHEDLKNSEITGNQRYSPILSHILIARFILTLFCISQIL